MTKQEKLTVTASAEHGAADQFEVKLDAKTLKAKSAKGSILFGSSQVFRLVLQLASQVVLARLLFPSDYGLLAMVYPVINFAAIFSIGFGETVIQRPELKQDQVSALFWISTLMSCVVALILMGAAPLVSLIFSEPRLTLLIIATAAYMPLSALGGVQGALLNRQMKFKTIVAIDVVSALISTGVTIVTAWLGWSYWSLAAGNFALAAVSSALTWYYGNWRPSRPRFVATLLDDLKFGGNITGYNLANFLTTSGDSIIIGYFNGERALGVYDRSYRLVVAPIGQLVAPFGRVMVPLLSRLMDDAQEYCRAFTMTVKIIIVMTVPCMLVCVVHGPEVVSILLGPRWTEAGELLSWISVMGLTSGLQATALWLFVSQARMRGLRRMTISTSVLNLMSFAIGSIWGIKGVAISVGLTFSLVTTPLIMYGATRRGPVDTRSLIAACLPYIGAGAVAAVILVALRQASGYSAIVQVVVALIVSYAVFVATALGPPEERRRIIGAIKTFRRAR